MFGIAPISIWLDTVHSLVETLNSTFFSYSLCLDFYPFETSTETGDTLVEATINLHLVVVQLCIILNTFSFV